MSIFHIFLRNMPGEYRGIGKVPGDDVKGGHPGSDPVGERDLGGHGHDDDGTGRFSPYY